MNTAIELALLRAERDALLFEDALLRREMGRLPWEVDTVESLQGEIDSLRRFAAYHREIIQINAEGIEDKEVHEKRASEAAARHILHTTPPVEPTAEPAAGYGEMCDARR